jgi:PAS domain S-box-containing protein
MSSSGTSTLPRGGGSTMGRAADKRPLASQPPTLPVPDAAAPGRLSMNDGRDPATADQLGPRVGADEHLAELEALYRASDAGLALIDREFRYRRLNEHLAAINGRPLEAHLGRTVREMVPALADELERSFDRVFQTGEALLGGRIEGETPSWPGIARSWTQDILPVKRCDGSVRAILVVIKAVSPDRTAETVARLAAIVESADEAIASKTLDGIVTSWNPAAETLFGYSADEIIGRHISVLAAPGREDEMPGNLERIRRGEKVDRYETLRRRKDGSLVAIALEVSPIRDESGRIIGASKIARDITEQRRLHEALRASEERFRNLANAVPDIVWTAASDGSITFANDRWFQYCGMTPEQNERGWPELVLHTDDRERCIAAWTRALREGTEYEIEVRNQRHDGEYRWFLTRAAPIRDREGRITAWFGSTTDIHDRKQTEERQEILTAELAHRVKNLLTVIGVLAERTGDRAASVEQFLESFRGRIRALNAAQAALIATDRQGASLAALVQAALEPYLLDAGRIDIDVQDLPIRPEFALTLTLALHELATNASKYGALSSATGRVRLSARIQPAATGEEFLLVWQEDGGPPVQPPSTAGFGTTMLGKALEYQHQGQTELIWREAGLLCRLKLPLSEVTVPPGAIWTAPALS